MTFLIFYEQKHLSIALVEIKKRHLTFKKWLFWKRKVALGTTESAALSLSYLA